MKKIIYSFMALALFGAVSCESMLDIPKKGSVAYETYYASDADAEAAITSMYANFVQQVAGTEGIDNPEQVMLNYAADDIMAAGGNAADHAPFRYFCEFTYDNANGTLKEAYQRYIFTIYHANLVISNFTNENKAGSAPKWESDYTKQVVAEARVMRAYLHMMLALSWERPPIIDRLQEGDDLPANAESQDAVLKFVVDECQKAIDSGYLPKRNGQTDKDGTARMSVGFAQFVAGKASLFRGDDASARTYLSALIESNDYDLIEGEDYWTNFHSVGDGNKETIFEPNFHDDSNYTANWWGAGVPIHRSRWMVANVFNWGVGKLASMVMPSYGVDGWNGGAIQQDFAAKFLAHDGDSPRRLACFLTEEEWLYEMDWSGSTVNDGTPEQKKADPNRGIKALDGLFSHGPYFEWKHMVFINPPKILTGGKSYPSDHVPSLGATNTNQTNFNVARYAEALLLYAEACIGSADASKGLAALNKVQQRSGSGKISSELTIENVIEEKQYEMWFENCRFHDLVRWSKRYPNLVNLDNVFNKSGIHQKVPTVFDEFFIEGKPGYQKEHKLFTVEAPVEAGFVTGKHEYFPFPHDFMLVNPNLKNFNGWASAE